MRCKFFCNICFTVVNKTPKGVYQDATVKKIVHVNRQHIAMNAKDGGNRPVYTIKMAGKTRYAREVEILGPCRLVYDGSQLACGARAWITTESEVNLVDEMSFAEARAAS